MGIKFFLNQLQENSKSLIYILFSANQSKIKIVSPIFNQANPTFDFSRHNA